MPRRRQKENRKKASKRKDNAPDFARHLHTLLLANNKKIYLKDLPELLGMDKALCLRLINRIIHRGLLPIEKCKDESCKGRGRKPVIIQLISDEQLSHPVDLPQVPGFPASSENTIESVIEITPNNDGSTINPVSTTTTTDSHPKFNDNPATNTTTTTINSASKRGLNGQGNENRLTSNNEIGTTLSELKDTVQQLVKYMKNAPPSLIPVRLTPVPGFNPQSSTEEEDIWQQLPGDRPHIIISVPKLPGMTKEESKKVWAEMGNELRGKLRKIRDRIDNDDNNNDDGDNTERVTTDEFPLTSIIEESASN